MGSRLRGNDVEFGGDGGTGNEDGVWNDIARGGGVVTNFAAAFLAQLGDAPSADLIAEALSHHFSAIVFGELPLSAQSVGREIAQMLKADATKPLPPRVLAATASWPKDRNAKLIDAIRRLAAILDQIENDRLDDAVRDSMRRHYL